MTTMTHPTDTTVATTPTGDDDLTTAERRSVRRRARLAGILYLVIFVAGPFAFMLGRTSPVVAGDATATAANIVESDTMFRVGMVAETIVVGVEIVLAAILYVLLRPVSRSVSLAAAFARFGEAIVQAVNLVTGGIVLLLLSGAGYLAAFDSAQLDALAMVFVEMNDFLIMIWGLLFGLHLAMLGWLVHRSGFWPRLLGQLLMVAALGYLAQGYGHLVAPRFDDALAVAVQVLAIPGELAFTIWLLWKGIDVDRWARRRREASRV